MINEMMEGYGMEPERHVSTVEKLSPEFIKHFPDAGARCFTTGRVEGEMRAEGDCECGVLERHTHCPGCGRVISRGDWDARPIAAFHIPL